MNLVSMHPNIKNRIDKKMRHKLGRYQNKEIIYLMKKSFKKVNSD